MRWEYRTVSLGASSGFWPFASGDVAGDEITATLNRLGREGWELVSAFASARLRRGSAPSRALQAVTGSDGGRPRW
jgi:hypothetical protein